MASKKNVHVVPDSSGGWKTKREGSSRASSQHRKQSTAIEAGRNLAKKDGVELVIHGRNGRIRDNVSYGNDPHPPKDTKH